MTVVNYHTVNGEVIGETTVGQPRIDYLTDALGSITATVNQSAQVVNTYRYKPYGDLLAKTGPDPDPAFGWLGSKGYRRTGNKFSDFYVRARHYDTAAGRWPTVDALWPITSAFEYALSSPTRHTDRSGLNPVSNFPGSGCDPKGSFQKTLNDCCNSLDKVLNDSRLLSDLMRCMSEKGFGSKDSQNAISAALTWLYLACKDPTINVCVWCAPIEIPRSPPIIPPAWPRDAQGNLMCELKCLTPGEAQWFTPLPVSTPYLSKTGTDCPPYPRGKGCAALGSVAISGGGTMQCDAAIVSCFKGDDPVEACSVLMHELTHAGGIYGRAGGHMQTDPKTGQQSPGSDFIFALECCLCYAMNPGKGMNANPQCIRDCRAWGGGQFKGED